jgi:hypothetical protein
MGFSRVEEVLLVNSLLTKGRKYLANRLTVERVAEGHQEWDSQPVMAHAKREGRDRRDLPSERE